MREVAFEGVRDRAFDDNELPTVLRASVREAIEDALTKSPGRVDTRREVRSAAERLGNALVAHAEAANESGTPLTAHANARTASAATLDESRRRGRAFRVMAGVRQ